MNPTPGLDLPPLFRCASDTPDAPLLGYHDGISSWTLNAAADPDGLRQAFVSHHERAHHQLHASSAWGTAMLVTSGKFAIVIPVVNEIYRISNNETWKYGITRQVNGASRPSSQISACNGYYHSQCTYRVVAVVTGWYTARFLEASLFFRYVYYHHRCPPGVPACI